MKEWTIRCQIPGAIHVVSKEDHNTWNVDVHVLQHFFVLSEQIARLYTAYVIHSILQKIFRLYMLVHKEHPELLMTIPKDDPSFTSLAV